MPDVRSILHRLRGFAGVSRILSIENLPDRETDYGLLFSHGYYCSQLPGLKLEQAQQHFESIGWQLGLSPHPLFSTRYYLETHNFALDENPLRHYLTKGWKNGANPHPLFDIQYYSAASGVDFVDDTGKQVYDPLTHYLTSGWPQGFNPHPLVSLYYCQRPRRPKEIVGDPLSFCIKNRFKQAFRPHPLFHGGRLSTQLKFRRRVVDSQTFAEQFANWTATTSPTPLFDQPFYESRYPESVAYSGGAFRHFVEVGQFQKYDPNPFFDSEFYCAEYGDLVDDAPSPFMHFMTKEITLRFDPCEDFDIAHYHATNPGVRKSGKSLLEHFLNNGRFSSREIAKHRIPRFLVEDVLEAAAIDPSIQFSPKKLRKLKVVNRHQSLKVADHYYVLRGHLRAPFKVLVMAPFLKRGGADLVAVNLIRCLHQQYAKEDVLLMLTDGEDMVAANWLPEDTRYVVLSHLDKTMSIRERERLLQLVVDEFRPQVCYNVNSHAGWELFARQGRGLAQWTKLAGFLFCFDYREENKPVGYAVQHFPRACEHLSDVYVDNDAFRSVLIDTFDLPSSQQQKLQTVYQPMRDIGHAIDINPLIERLGREDNYRRQVIWAGRLDRQKRPDVMLEIARRCPQFDFHVHGTSVLDQLKEFGGDPPENVQFYGEFPDTFKLPLAEMDLFLYTSQWDGLPTLLIDIAQVGLPVVAADSGGIAELIHEQPGSETGWLIDHVDNVDAYVASLKEMAVSPEQCLQRIERCRELVNRQHHWDAYSATILKGVSARK